MNFFSIITKKTLVCLFKIVIYRNFYQKILKNCLQPTIRKVARRTSFVELNIPCKIYGIFWNFKTDVLYAGNKSKVVQIEVSIVYHLICKNC